MIFRYAEQKLRLKKSGIRNVIVVAEGGEAPDRSLEQALASTSVSNQFFIQRTANIQGTAKFLHAVTQRLRERAVKDTVSLFEKKLNVILALTQPFLVYRTFIRFITI